ncbi:hypothetical protein [Ornithinimicrobium pratense]|uniref:Uncharacterized protein n=1 Tax=Ornithinimicrobium pratense TaxID=2593973 RepID=A0A5J6V5K4_9MICO|nr:hypothetical protein [Ornithinimicrobium pratense]QFG69048.1 hypothetical protein FY030_10340 [Ornithinimicrobium pratense]
MLPRGVNQTKNGTAEETAKSARNTALNLGVKTASVTTELVREWNDDGHLLDAADAAALDASDALVEERAYGEGIGAGVPLTDASVQAAAGAYLATRPLPGRVAAWSLGPGTGSPDGRTAVVVLTGQAQIPVVSPVLSAFGGGVSVTVTSSARSDLQP